MRNKEGKRRPLCKQFYLVEFWLSKSKCALGFSL